MGFPPRPHRASIASAIAAIFILSVAPISEARSSRDLDRDGLSNRYELKRSHTKPRRADTDGDKLRDGFEVRRSKTSPLRRDTDRDGVSDRIELLAGTDPLTRGKKRRPPDSTPPETTITSGPSGTVATSAVSFGFSSSEAGSSFECRVDGAAWAKCVSPRNQSGLADGSHTFGVRAIDVAGNTDPSPATRTWIVATTPAPEPPSPPAPSSTCSLQPFCADWETGSYGQWWLHQWSINRDPNQGYTNANVGSSEVIVQASTVKQGQHAGMFRVYPHSGPSANDRAEVVATQAQSGGYPGQEWWYGWWTYFPGPSQDWWDAGGDWNDIVQFQSTDDSGGFIYLNVNAADYPQPQLQIKGGPAGRTALGALRYDHWYHFVVHARWAANSTGIFELWLDDSLVMSRTGQTLKNQSSPCCGFTGPGMYFSQGIYRGAHTSTNTVVHDGFCRGATRAAVEGC